MPNASIDLHLHSYYSDGRFSPADLLHHAESIGLKVVAITDHDNLDAWEEASRLAPTLGLELVPGIELTTRWPACEMPGSLDQDVDLLGYFFDPGDPPLQAFTRASLQDFRSRIDECCSLLTQAGYPLTIYDLLDENPRFPGALQLVTALHHKGLVPGWNEALALFNRYWPQVRPCGVDIKAAIAALHAAGGVSVLAHPVAIYCGGSLLGAELLAELAAAGLDGLEIFHPRLDAAARQHFQYLAQRFNLAISGGSDEHGWIGGFARMGSQLVTYAMVTELKARRRTAP